MGSMLTKSYPWPTTSCNHRACFPCTSADPARPPRFSCRTPGIAYRITCLTCKAEGRTSTYEGETGRNGFSRGLEHKSNLRNRSKNSPLVSHMNLFHQGAQPAFRMEVIKTFKDPLTRQIEEASRIQENAEHPGAMNKRSEWRSTPLPQVGFTQGRVAPGSRPTFTQQGLPQELPDRPAIRRPVLEATPGPGLGPDAPQLQDNPLQVPQQQHLQAHHPLQDPLWSTLLVPRVSPQPQHPEVPPLEPTQFQHPRVPLQEHPRVPPLEPSQDQPPGVPLGEESQPHHQDPQPRRERTGPRWRKNH